MRNFINKVKNTLPHKRVKTVAGAAANAAIAVGGKVQEVSIPAATLLVLTGITARGLLRRLVARHDYEGFLRQENKLLEQKAAVLHEMQSSY